MKLSASALLPLIVAAAGTGLALSQPANDICEDAPDLTANGPPVVGTTVDATHETTGYCNNTGTSRNAGPPAVWYKVAGNGRRMSASTCSDGTEYPTSLVVMWADTWKLTRTCNTFACPFNCIIDLECEGSSSGAFSGDQNGVGSDFDPKCPENANAARVEWDSMVNRTYFIPVTGREEGAEGNFALEVKDFESPSNDFCEGAVVLNKEGGSASGTTVNATRVRYLGCKNQGQFGYSAVPLTREVWYAAEGSGKKVSLSVSSAGGEFAPSMVVHRDQCPDRINGYLTLGGCEGSGTTLTWDSVENRTYYVAVYGLEEDAAEGGFTIDFTVFEPPPNDRCAGAVEIVPGQTRVESMATATSFDPPHTYFYSGESKPKTIWYTFTGNGRPMRLTSTEKFIMYGTEPSKCPEKGDTQFSYSESSTSGFSHGHFFFSEDQKIYYVAVFTSASIPEGETMSITLQDYIPPENDKCADAILLQPDAPPIQGTNQNATMSTDEGALGLCFYQYGLQFVTVWYRVEGTGSNATVALAGIDNHLAANEQFGLLVMDACPEVDPDAPACSSIATNKVSGKEVLQNAVFLTEVTWETAAGTTYYVGVLPGANRWDRRVIATFDIGLGGESLSTDATGAPSAVPSSIPSAMPSPTPLTGSAPTPPTGSSGGSSPQPSSSFSTSPSSAPTESPTSEPSSLPTQSMSPTSSPSGLPSDAPTISPAPTNSPSARPSEVPSGPTETSDALGRGVKGWEISAFSVFAVVAILL